MGVFDSFKELVTQKPVGLKKPDFYKADSDAKKQLERLLISATGNYQQ